MSNFPPIRPKPATLSNVLPQELLSHDRWLVWKAVPQPNGKPRKTPYYINGRRRAGKLGGPTDLKNLASFGAASAKYLSDPTEWAGIGFALIDGDGVGALDFDGCIHKGAKQAVDPVVENAILQVRQLGVYLEVSPSGNGLRAIGSTHGLKNMMKPYEAYCRDRFVTITGKCLFGAQAWVNIDSVVSSAQSLPQLPPISAGHSLPRRTSKLSAAVSAIYSPLPETPSEIARVKDALSHVSPDLDYNEWRSILCALHSTTWTIAEDLARDWSAGGDAENPTAAKYNSSDFDREWARLKLGGSITIATLIHKAKQNGWQQPPVALPTSNATPSVQQKVKPTKINVASATPPPASGPPQPLVDPHSTGDIRNGQEFACRFKDKLMYIHETKEFFKFEPCGWSVAEPNFPIQKAQEVVHDFRQRIEILKTVRNAIDAKELSKHADWSSKLGNLKSMIELGCSHPSMSVPLTKLDSDPNLFGVANGVLDLTHGVLAQLTPQVLVTKRSGVAFDPSAKAPLFLEFIDRVQPDPDVRRFLRQIAGLFLLGNVLEQRLFFFYGSGANGKSTFIELMQYIMGEYAHSFDINSFLKQALASRGATPELVAFRGMRLSHSSEIPLGAKIDEQRVKLLTGGDTICARDLYEKTINFKPSHSLVMVGNHLPEIRAVSDAMRRRLLLIGFNTQIAEAKRDPQLLKKLKAEGSGVLNWMLEGLKDYLANGLLVPQSVNNASAEFMEAEDLLGQWLGECCNTGAGLSVNRQEAYRSYKWWAEDGGHKPMSQHTLTRRLNERSFDQDDGRRNYQGINLKAQGVGQVSGVGGR